MNKLTLGAIAVAVCGFAGAASAAPIGLGSDISVGSPVENVRVVCRERTVWRTDRWGHPRRVTVRDCDRVGRRYHDDRRYYGYGDRRYYNEGRYVGPRGRYYHEGSYYEDPGFTIRIR